MDAPPARFLAGTSFSKILSAPWYSVRSVSPWFLQRTLCSLRDLPSELRSLCDLQPRARYLAIDDALGRHLRDQPEDRCALGPSDVADQRRVDAPRDGKVSGQGRETFPARDPD